MSEPDLKKETLEFISKWYVWACYIFIGMIAHVAHMVMSNRKRTWLQSIASMCLAGFVGYLATLYCISYTTPMQGGIIVPMATLSSEKILKGIMGIDWSQIIKTLFNLNKKDD